MWNPIIFSKRWIPRSGKSQTKGDKPLTGVKSPAASDKPSLKKISSDKKLKLPYGDNVRSDEAAGDHSGAAALDEAEDDAPDVELPPPMEPIQNPQAVLQQAPIPTAATSEPATREQHGGVASGSARPCDGEDEEPSTPNVESSEAILKKREYVLRELYDTEKDYVSDLRLVCEGYMKYNMMDPQADPPLPEGLRDGRLRLIFGNIKDIYEWHRDKFVHDLEACVEAPECLGPLFRRFLEKKMCLYETYCRNKPYSEYIVSGHEHYFHEMRLKLEHKLQLGDLLIKPIQRIQKYHLLVKKILTYSENANAPANVIASLRDAVYCTSIIPKNANDMMDLSRLQGFKDEIEKQGKLLFKEPLIVSDANNANEKGKEMHVFLFEQCVIFTEALGKKSQFSNLTYNYKAHIQVNKMKLEKVEGANMFIIRSDDKKKSRAFLCRASETRLQHWISTLSQILESQQIFGQRLENPSAFLQRDLVGEGWCGLRKTESVPPSLGARLVPDMRGRTQRPHAKANTINLPTSARDDYKKTNTDAAVSPTSPPHSNV